MAKVYANVNRETGEKEAQDSLLRRFKKAVLRDEILKECKKREYFKPKALKRKEKSIEAMKRNKAKNKGKKNY